MATKREIFEKLQQDILMWQGVRAQSADAAERLGLGELENAFPNGVFPRRAIHEFITASPEDVAASDGFIGALLAILMENGGPCVWVSTSRKLFPISLSAFNVEPDRIIFMDARSEKEVLWITEEALRCEGLVAVISELPSLSLVESRRLQLAVEQSGVTGFIFRKDPSKMASNVASVRWQVSPLPSGNEEGMPGLGFPRWQVELLKVRSGSTGRWMLEWAGDRFQEVVPEKKTVLQWPENGDRQIG